MKGHVSTILMNLYTRASWANGWFDSCAGYSERFAAVGSGAKL